jgi:coiled-coil domain-containing protein 40
MQEALDPNFGQSEIEELRKELHRMELRYNSLLKEQAKIVSEAERAIDKKEQIEMKYVASVKKETVKQKQPETSNQLKNSIRNIKDNQNKIMKSLQDTEKMLSRKENDLENMAQQIEDSLAELKML